MREILFKAKRLDNGEWVEGMPIFDGTDEQWRIVMQLDYSTGTCIQTEYAPRVIAKTICQNTGLTNKNGQKIWENDIVRYNEEDWFPYAVVKYGEYKNNGNMDCYLGFYMDWQNDNYFRVDIGYWVKNRDIEVIGNIFDNPELLKGE